MNCDYKDKIISYIENDLSKAEMSKFKKELDKNTELKLEYEEMKAILNSFENLPKVEAPSDFIVQLNNKIDDYESKKVSNLFNKIFNYNYLPQISIGAVTLICLFAINYFGLTSIGGDSEISLSNSSKIVNTDDNQIADADSLDINENIQE